jgi:hypothetical protein
VSPLVDLLERDWTAQVVGTAAKPGLASPLGWHVYHTLRSKGSQPGFPDWVLARERILFLDLKRETGRMSQAQVAWGHALLAAGAEYYLVRPRHLDAVGPVLGRRGRPAAGDRGDVDQLVAYTLAELRREAAG